MPSDRGQRTLDKPRVLLVEDDGITARYVHNCLRSAGYPPPVVVSSAEEALNLARAERPDLVLMDIVLRGEMDGVDAAGRIREHTGAPVVFLTACSDEDTRQRALAAGACGYLVKPFLERELCAAVGHALHWPSPSRPPPIMAELRSAQGQRSWPIDPPGSLDLDSAHEELRVLADELQRQNEELTRAQRRAEVERQRYQSLFDLAPDGYLVTDGMGVILEANQGAGELLGVAPLHLAGKPLSVFLPHGGHQDYYELLGHLEREQQRRLWKTPLRPRDREPFHASLTILPVRDAEGHPVVLHWMIRDISAHVAAEQALREARDTLEARVRERTAELTRLNRALQSEIAERRRTEESLRESRQLLQSIADAAPNMLYAYDLRERRTIYANTRVEMSLGYPSDAMRGLVLDACIDLVHPDDRGSAERHSELLQRAADGEVVELVLRLRHHDGSWRWVRFRDVVSTRDASGAPARCVGTAEDVTEQRAAQAALVRAEKLADTGRLAASFAHEINNPLQGVLGCLGLLEEALAGGREAGRYLEVAQREVRRAVRVVGQLRDLGRQARAPTERVATDLREIVSQVVAVTEKRAADEGIRVTWEPPDAVPEVVADADSIQQVFLNLALNALDTMSDGGCLRLGIHTTSSPDGVCVTFADNGPGIEPDLVPRLFGSFVTTKPEGLGLGLYISRNIVEQHGGRIEVETQLGSGATFAVWLPADTPEPSSQH